VPAPRIRPTRNSSATRRHRDAPAARPVSRTTRGAATSQRILDAAEDLFARLGYRATTVREIAEAVGIRDASLYKHFASKEALYEAVLERGFRPLLDALEQQREAGDTSRTTLPDRIMDILAARPTLGRLMLQEMLTGELSVPLQRWFGSLLEHGWTIWQEASGDLGHEPSRLEVIALMSLTLGYCASPALLSLMDGSDPFAEPGRRDQRRIVKRVAESLLEENA
jgi:AcrR family transcriptional regulator